MFFGASSRALALLLLAATSTIAHNIALPAHGRECFHENLHHDDKMTVTFQVGDREFGGAGTLDIDFWVRAQRAIASSAGGGEGKNKVANGVVSR
jgi:hypothetical protein